MPKTCCTCTEALYNAYWGEWRCGKKIITIYDIHLASTCKDYNEKKEKKDG